MHIKRLLVDFATVFILTLVVTSVVTLLWNLAFEGAGIVDWGTSFRFAIALGIILTWMETRRSKPKQRSCVTSV